MVRSGGNGVIVGRYGRNSGVLVKNPKMGVKEWVVIRKEHNSGENMGEIVGG